MRKIVTPDSWDFDEPATVQIPLLRSRKLGASDRKDLEKRISGDMLEKFAQLELHPGEVPVHNIAVGCTEFWNPNRNGDGFREAVCREYHPTFVKSAKVYRGHKSGPGAKFYGTVKLSQYHEKMHRIELILGLFANKEAAAQYGANARMADIEMEKLANDEPISTSMGCKISHDVCLAAGTLVETSEGLAPIETLKSGQYVRSHTGQLCQIRETMLRPYCGTMITLKIMCLPDALAATDAHPFYLLRRDAITNCQGSVNGHQRRCTYRNGRDICTTCHKPASGMFQWTTAQDIRVGDFVTYPVQPPGRTTVGSSLAYLLGLYAGDGCPIRRRRGRDRQGDSYLCGISVTLDEKVPSVIELTQQHAKVLHGRQQPACSAGQGRKAKCLGIYSKKLVNAALQYIGEGCHTKRIAAQVFNWNRTGRLQFLAGCLDSDGSVDRGCRYGCGRFTSTNRQLASAVQRLWWGLGVQAGMQRAFSDSYGGKTEYFVVSIPRSGVALLSEFSGKAAGITEPLWAVNKSFLLHGYMCLPVQSITAEYNELDVFNLAVETDESYIAGVAVHNCSHCGHKSKAPIEYCDARTCKAGGLKKHMGEVQSDGSILHADNPDPDFNDISHVKRGADRISFLMGALRKAAGCNEPLPLNGFELAELTYTPDYETKLSRLGREVSTAEQHVSLTNKLAMSCLAGARLQEFFVPEEIRDDRKLVQACAALADQNIILPAEQFVHLLTGQKNAAANIQAELPGIFDRMSYPLVNPFACYEPVPMRYRAWAEELAPSFSLAKSAVMRRIGIASLRGLEVMCASQQKRASSNVIVAEAAQQYALYVLAALDRNARNENLGLTTTLSLLQNHIN